jgi:hypothetical protein
MGAMISFAEFLLKRENASGVRGQLDAFHTNMDSKAMYGADYTKAKKELIDAEYGGDSVAAMKDPEFPGKLWAKTQKLAQGFAGERM